MHRCPFRDLAEEHGDVVCSVHLGLIRGALAVGAPVTATRLEPFVEPSLCRARLGKSGVIIPRWTSTSFRPGGRLPSS